MCIESQSSGYTKKPDLQKRCIAIFGGGANCGTYCCSWCGARCCNGQGSSRVCDAIQWSGGCCGGSPWSPEMVILLQRGSNCVTVAVVRCRGVIRFAGKGVMPVEEELFFLVASAFFSFSHLASLFFFFLIVCLFGSGRDFVFATR